MAPSDDDVGHGVQHSDVSGIGGLLRPFLAAAWLCHCQAAHPHPAAKEESSQLAEKKGSVFTGRTPPVPKQLADADSGGCTLVMLERFLYSLPTQFALSGRGNWRGGLLL